MISIRQLIDQHRQKTQPDPDVLEASLQMGRLLLEGVERHMVRGREVDSRAFGRTMKELLRRMEAPPSALDLLEVSSEAIDALETYSQKTGEYLRDGNEQMQSMISMLTDTLADVSGQADASVARLHAIEHQIEVASGLEDMRTLSASLESCLAALREAAAEQRRGSASTVQRLREQIRTAQTRVSPGRASPAFDGSDIDLVPEPLEETGEISATAYVAAFKLQRAEHIASRFGDGVKHQMLALISQSLKKVLRSGDRLLRWKGTSFVMFVKSTATLGELRAELAEAVAQTGQHYVEVGKKSALLSIGVDWTVFPQAQCASLDAVFAEVDAFLRSETHAHAPGMVAKNAARTE